MGRWKYKIINTIIQNGKNFIGNDTISIFDESIKINLSNVKSEEEFKSEMKKQLLNLYNLALPVNHKSKNLHIQHIILLKF